MRRRAMVTMMSLTMTTNPNMAHTSTHKGTSMGTGAYMRPRVSAFLQDIGMHADTLRMETAVEAVVVVRRMNRSQAHINNIKNNDKKQLQKYHLHNPRLHLNQTVAQTFRHSPPVTPLLPLLPLLHHPPSTPRWHRGRFHGRDR